MSWTARLIVLALGLMVSIPAALGWLTPLQRRDLDLMLVTRQAWRLAPEADARIVLIPLDPRTLRKLGKPTAFWGDDYRRVIEHLLASGAVAVGVDVFFNPPYQNLEPAVASTLQSQLESLGMTVLENPVVLVELAQSGTRNARSAPQLDLAADAMGNLGFANLQVDPDEKVRRLPLIVSERDRTLKLFSGRLAELALDQPLTPDEVPSERGALLINYPSRFQWLNFSHLLDLPRLDLKGKVCLIGPGEDDGDVHATPLGEKSGLEIHGAALHTLLSGNYLRRLGPASSLLLHLVFVGLGLWLGSRGGLGISAAAVVGTIYTAICLMMFATTGLIWPLTSGLLALVVTCSAAFGLQYQSLRESRRHLRDVLGRYVSRQVMQSLLEHPERLGFEGERRTVTILFSDITGFTETCENLAPEAVVAMLNRYFQEMVAIVDAHGGTVKQFIGDEIMILFGAPEPMDDHAARAVATAVAMRNRLAELDRPDAPPGFYHVKMGLHSGEVLLGNIGSSERSEYTAIGDSVNLAARIEATAGQMGETILVSATTVELARRHNDSFPFASRGLKSFKGRTQEMEVFSL